MDILKNKIKSAGSQASEGEVKTTAPAKNFGGSSGGAGLAGLCRNFISVGKRT